MTKVKVHAKVAEVLDVFKAQEVDNQAILKAVLASEGSPDGILMLEDFDVILNALANGYEAKLEPEEMIRRYYVEAKHNAWEADERDNETELQVANAKKEAVEYVLEQLGIRIEGVR